MGTTPTTTATPTPGTAEPKRSWLGQAGGLTWTWLSTFAGAVALFIVVGLLVGVVCAFVAASGWVVRLGMASLVLTVFAAVSVGPAVYKATSATAVDATRRFNLPRLLVNKVFDRLERTGEAQSKLGEVHSLPLGEAEARLRQIISRLDPELPGRGRLARLVLRAVHGRLVRLIEQITLAEFRKTAGEGEQVDLEKVRAYVAREVDRFVGDRLLGTARSAVRRLLMLLAIAAFAFAYIARKTPQWLPSWSGPPATQQPAAQPATRPATAPATLPAVEG